MTSSDSDDVPILVISDNDDDQNPPLPKKEEKTISHIPRDTIFYFNQYRQNVYLPPDSINNHKM